MNYLLLSVGRRAELLKYIRASMEPGSKIIATDMSSYAPAIYFADKNYVVPRIDAPNYINEILDICKKEKINVVTTFIDPEIELLARNREKFSGLGVKVLAPSEETAHICFDKFLMFQYLKSKNISTVSTWENLESFESALSNKEIKFPVFVKPRTGSGSVGAKKVINNEQLVEIIKNNSDYIIQEFMSGSDIDVDVYVDNVTHEVVSAFSKIKIETRIGGASKTKSFKDDKLFDLITEIVSHFCFNGPIDMDFFCVNGKYYLSEINPRFGGGYLHAYGAGVDFIKLIENNIKGNINDKSVGQYEENTVMMMYDSIVLMREADLVK